MQCSLLAKALEKDLRHLRPTASQTFSDIVAGHFLSVVHNPDSRNALKGDGGVFDGAQDAVTVAG